MKFLLSKRNELFLTEQIARRDFKILRNSDKLMELLRQLIPSIKSIRLCLVLLKKFQHDLDHFHYKGFGKKFERFYVSFG